jgi:hypothetical protein
VVSTVPVGDLRDLCVGRRGVFRHRLSLRRRRLDLCIEDFVIALRLVELLCGGGVLLEQAARSLEVAACDVTLDFVHAHLVGDFPDARTDGGALREHLASLKRELGGVNDANQRVALETSALGGFELEQLSARLCGYSNFFRLEVAVGVGLFLGPTGGQKQEGDGNKCRAHQRVSKPSVVRSRARAWASSTR